MFPTGPSLSSSKMPVKDLFHFGGPLLNQSLKEYITPHKISVSILIQEFCLLKTKKNSSLQLGDDFSKINETEGGNTPIILEPRHRRDFCMLILKLIQCPDMEYSELIEVLESGKYALISEHLENFKRELISLASKDVGSIMDTILSLGRFIVEPANIVPLINKSSPIGVFLRRVQLFFDKLAFSQLVGTCKAFQSYLNQSNAISESNLNSVTSSLILGTVPQHPQPALQHLSSSSIDMTGELTEEMDVCSSSVVQQTDLLLQDCNLVGGAYGANKRNINSHDASNSSGNEKKIAGTWSRRQAELFIARQAMLIQSDDNNAISPPQLQQKIREVLKANPEHAEAHYLSYLNCLRVKELCGSIDSLHHYFDRITTVSLQEEKNKGFRFAALNIAILHAQFEQKKAAVDALKEAINLAHEAKDNFCLQHAQAWLYKLCDENKEILMERSISKCSDLSLNYLTSLGLQSFAQYAGMTGGKPALVFEVVMRSDVLNCQFSMPDMFGMSFAHKAALWALYGKSEMSALCSQLLLHLDTPDGSITHTADGTSQAICNLANRLIDFGEYKLATVVLDHARVMYPNSYWWLIVEQVLYYTQALYQGQWQVAHSAVLQLSTLDKWESLIRRAELLLAKGDNEGVMNAVSEVLDDAPSVCPSLKVRALLLVAKANPSAATSVLTNALSIAIYHYLDYLIALVVMELANLQLQMGLPNQALKLMDQSLLVVLSHGSQYDQASALLLFVQCKVASVATPGSDAKNEVINEAISLLDKAKSSYRKVEAYSKVKETVYLQALLSHEICCYNERNKYALEFRQLDELYPTKCLPVTS